MTLASGCTVTGRVTIDMFDRTGARFSRTEVNNTVVESGRTLLARLLAGSSGTVTHLAIGRGGVSPLAGDTALGDEVVRVPATPLPVTAPETVFRAVLPAGVGTGALSEVGLFTAPTGGELFSRATFPAVTKQPWAVAIISWTITQS